MAFSLIATRLIFLKHYLGHLVFLHRHIVWLLISSEVKYKLSLALIYFVALFLMPSSPDPLGPRALLCLQPPGCAISHNPPHPHFWHAFSHLAFKSLLTFQDSSEMWPEVGHFPLAFLSNICHVTSLSYTCPWACHLFGRWTLNEQRWCLVRC